MTDVPETKPIELSEDKPAFESGDITAKPEGEVAAVFDKEIKVGGEPDKKDVKEIDDKTDKSDEDVKEEPDSAFRSFKSQEELDTYFNQETEKRKSAPPVEDKKPEKKSVELYKGYYDEKTGKWVGETPRDWNEFANKIIGVMTPQVAQEVRTMSEKDRQELEKINQEYDREYNELASQKLVPALNTKAGAKVNKQVSLIGATYGQTSIKKAHELWSKIPKDQGGGLDYEAETETKDKIKAQKQAAGKVGSSKGTPSKQKTKQIPYSKLQDTHLDDLVDQQLEQ